MTFDQLMAKVKNGMVRGGAVNASLQKLDGTTTDILICPTENESKDIGADLIANIRKAMIAGDAEVAPEVGDLVLVNDLTFRLSDVKPVEMAFRTVVFEVEMQ